MQRYVLVTGPTSQSVNYSIYEYTWGDTWGTLEYLDPDENSVYDWYRTNGNGVLIAGSSTPVDSKTILFSHPIGGGYYNNTTSGTTTLIQCNKGSLPRLSASDRAYITANIDLFTAGDDPEGMYRCPVYYGDDFAYFLFMDPSLDNVCNPGAFFMLRTHPSFTTGEIIHEYNASYENSSLTTSGTLVSGTSTIYLRMPWIATNDEGTTGFYMSASNYMKAGGFLYFETTTSTGIYVVNTIEADNAVTTTSGLRQTYADSTLVKYRYSEIIQENTVWVHPGDGKKDDSSRTTDTLVRTTGEMSTNCIVESFIPIPTAIPAPYSIRNPPYTNIWMFLQNPGIPLNTTTLLYKINGVDVTDQVQVTQVTGGMELFYNPAEDFDLASRVTVYVYISASPSIYRTVGRTMPVGGRYLKVGGGDLSYFQPGGLLQIGPNAGGDSETVYVEGIVSDNELLIDATTYEYSVGDQLLYVYDDYPLELNYWFDIVDDYLPPEIYNMYPSTGMTGINVMQPIRFEIQDEGLGVDISTLTFTVNNLVVNPSIYKYSDQWYEVIYTPTYPCYYDSIVCCFATVADSSSSQNRGYATWSFTTVEAEVPMMLNPDPAQCAFPVNHKGDISVDVYARGGGANLPSLVFTIDQKEQEPHAYPKIYRYK